MRPLLLLPLLLAVATPACMPPAPRALALRPTVGVFEAPKDRVWSALVAVVGIDLPIQAIERESGLLTTRPMEMSLPASQWAKNCDAPGDFSEPWNQLRMDLRALVEAEGGRTRVTLACHYEAFKHSTFPRAWTVEASTGKLEADLMARIGQRLAQ